MKKVTLLIGAKNKNQALESLRSLGVLHVQNITPPLSEDISALQSEIGAVETVLNSFEGLEIPQKTTDSPREIVKKHHKLVEKKTHLTDEMVQIIEQENWYLKWGDVKKSDLDELAEKGFFLKLYECDKTIVKNLPIDEIILTVAENKNSLLLVLISDNPETKLLNLKPEIAPEEEFEVISRETKIYKEQLATISLELRQLEEYRTCLKAYREDLEYQLEFAQVKQGMGDVESISYLQGYCPAETVGDFKAEAEKSGWGYMIEDPGEEDNPPTQLKNKKWVNMVQPVFDFLGTVPGYREYDISQYFLIFFAIYFAMIIGDAGYGVLFFLGAIFARTKVKKGTETPEALKLLFLLSITTTLWGAITGNWFGSAMVSGLAPMKALTIPQIATFPELFPDIEIDSQSKIMFICFVLALIQLGLANIMNFMNSFPSLKSFSHLGWLSLMGGLFFLVLNLVLGMELPGFALALIYIGLGGVIVFGSQEEGKSFLKGLLGGLGGAFTTFLDSISSFSNIISYIRLFAVGMASVAIASSFNDIAAPMLKGFALPAGLLVLLVGHGLNIVMGMLSVIVHGIRLNVLEFSGQLGIEWSGYKYKPFKGKK
ncbi:MAG: hypothetical protein JXQ65_13080 [Candidatus Marinimicrobia bacterium]|nr:hypothetical protein [Candidatus Neomarinimicrobiota bacterium]